MECRVYGLLFGVQGLWVLVRSAGSLQAMKWKQDTLVLPAGLNSRAFSLTLFLSPSPSLSLSLTHTHSIPPSLPLLVFFSLTHTHAHAHKQKQKQVMEWKKETLVPPTGLKRLVATEPRFYIAIKKYPY